jgi:hypothetical protein
VPVALANPYFVANPQDTGTAVSTVIVGRRQFIVPSFSNSPTSYDWSVYNNTTGDLLDADTGMVAPGDDYWLPGAELAGVPIALAVIAYNAAGASSVAISIKTVQAVDLSAAAPVLTRSSASDASPFTVSQSAFPSSVFEGYLVQRVLATDNVVDPTTGSFLHANIIYDEVATIGSSLVPADLVFPAFDDSGYPQVYEMRRIIAPPPADVDDVLSPWSNMVKKSDALTNSTAYTKYRVRTTNTGNGFATLIAEFKVAATPGGSDTANNSGVAITGTSSADTTPASNARDGNTATYWSCNLAAPNPTSFPHDLTLDYSGGTPIAANEFKISAATSGGASGAPRDFTIDGWNGSSWTTLRTGSGVTWTDGETKTYVL